MSLPASLRRGMSLVELIIAIGILAVVMGLVLDYSLSAKRYSTLAFAQDELAEEASRISRTMARDLSLSGWAISATASFAGGIALPANAATDRSSARYFPYVLSYGDTAEDPAIASGRFAHARISSAFLPDQALAREMLGSTPTITGYTSYRRAQIGVSHALVYLALQQGSWKATPSADPDFSLRFGQKDDSDLARWQEPDHHDALGVLFPTAYEETYASGVPTGLFTRLATVPAADSYGLTQDSAALIVKDGQYMLVPQWETIEPPLYDGTDGSPGSGTDHFGMWREYLLAVVRPPDGNRVGRLVRAYKTAVTTALTPGVEPGQLLTDPAQPYGFVVLEILSDNVSRLIVETSRSSPLLEAPPIDQVRLIVSLMRPLADADRSQRVPRQFTWSFSMRTQAESTIRRESTLSPDAVLTSCPHPSYPVAP